MGSALSHMLLGVWLLSVQPPRGHPNLSAFRWRVMDSASLARMSYLDLCMHLGARRLRVGAGGELYGADCAHAVVHSALGLEATGRQGVCPALSVGVLT